MWNDLHLAGPFQDICEYGKKDATLIENIPDLVSILTASAEILTEDHPIWEEVNIFKNIQAKYKRILHCDKCLQLLQRVGTCLRKMVLLKLSTVYLDLADKIIMELQSLKKTSYFLPSRQQLEYVLIRTQTAAKLICECLHYSREAFCFLIQRLKVGHLIINLMMATSVTARLNIVFKSLLVQIFDTYKKIYAWRQKLKLGGWEWPMPLELPEDLESWINVEDSEYLKPRHLPKEELDFLMTIFDRDNISTENLNVTQINNTESTLDESTNGEDCVILDNNDDNGVLVERSTIEEVVFSSSEGETTINSPLNEKKGKLSKAQKVLLKKIKKSENIKELKAIYDNLDFTDPNLLPQVLTPGKIRLIDKIFVRAKRKTIQLKKSKFTDTEKKQQTKLVVKIAQLNLAKNLGILHMKENTKKSNNMPEIKPAKTFKELKALQEAIYHRLQAAQKYQKCDRLKKTFKSRRADIRLLVESGEKEEAKQLIINTSNLLISEFI